MKIIKSVMIVGSLLLTVGCATLFSGTTQNIHIQAIDSKDNHILEGVTCSLTDGRGVSYVVPTNPGNVLVAKGAGGINPMCKKEGYIQKNFGVGDSFNAVSMVNIIFWPGFIVDAMSGAMHKYPSHIIIFMEPVGYTIVN